MLEQIIHMPTPFNMIVLVVLIGTLGSTISAVAKQIRIYLVTCEELNFKRELIHQGIAPGDIERVVASHRQAEPL